MDDFEYEGQVYTTKLERTCKGCAFATNAVGCISAMTHMDCGTRQIIWIKRAIEPTISDTPKDKQIELSFEDQLRDLIQKELILKGRKITSIYARNWASTGRPITLEIDYEHTAND